MTRLKNLRVLLVSPIGEIGGAEQVFLRLVEHLPNYNIVPILACMRPGSLVERAKQQGMQAYAFQEHRMRQLPMVLQGIKWLTTLIREADADIVHSNYTAHLYASPASRIAGVPEVWHIHDYPYKSDAIDRLQRRLPSNHVIFTTERVKSGYLKLHPCNHSVMAPTCVDPVYLRSLPHQPDIRRRYDLPEGPLFLTVARLQAHKGHQYLIAAIPSVLMHYPDAVFAIIGKASNADQMLYQSSLEAQCASLGISKQVKFLGYVDELDLVSLFHDATALVHPALSEGFGLTLLEAMALGVPVIAAASDGPKEMITHRKNGWLVPTADSKSLAQAIIYIAGNKDLISILKQQGEILVAQKSLENMVKQTIQIYESVAGIKRTVPL